MLSNDQIRLIIKGNLRASLTLYTETLFAEGERRETLAGALMELTRSMVTIEDSGLLGTTTHMQLWLEAKEKTTAPLSNDGRTVINGWARTVLETSFDEIRTLNKLKTILQNAFPGMQVIVDNETIFDDSPLPSADEVKNATKH